MAAQANDSRPAKKCGTIALWCMYVTAAGTAYGLPFAYTDAVLPTGAPYIKKKPSWSLNTMIYKKVLVEP